LRGFSRAPLGARPDLRITRSCRRFGTRVCLTSAWARSLRSSRSCHCNSPLCCQRSLTPSRLRMGRGRLLSRTCRTRIDLPSRCVGRSDHEGGPASAVASGLAERDALVGRVISSPLPNQAGRSRRSLIVSVLPRILRILRSHFEETPPALCAALCREGPSVEVVYVCVAGGERAA
jgi:hypothetical protein